MQRVEKKINNGSSGDNGNGNELDAQGMMSGDIWKWRILNFFLMKTLGQFCDTLHVGFLWAQRDRLELNQYVEENSNIIETSDHNSCCCMKVVRASTC